MSVWKALSQPYGSKHRPEGESDYASLDALRELHGTLAHDGRAVISGPVSIPATGLPQVLTADKGPVDCRLAVGAEVFRDDAPASLRDFNAVESIAAIGTWDGEVFVASFVMESFEVVEGRVEHDSAGALRLRGLRLVERTSQRRPALSRVPAGRRVSAALHDYGDGTAGVRHASLLR